MEDLHAFVVRRLNKAGKDEWPLIAEATGVPHNTIIKVARGTIESPRWRTLKPLVEHFRGGRAA